MISQLQATLGTGGLAFVMILGTLSFLAWMPAIAAVVVSEKPLLHRVPLFLALAVFPPLSLVVMTVSIQKATPDSPRRTRKREPRAKCAEAPTREAVPIRIRMERCHAAAQGA